MIHQQNMLRVWKLHGMKLRTIYQVRLRDDSTTDADEREDLVFTQNQWGDLNVFSATGDLLARIDSWEHDHTGNLASGMKRKITYQKGISTIQVRLLTTMTMIGTSLHVQTLRSNTSYLMML